MPENGKDIEQRMRRVRQEIERDAGQIAQSARQLTDWRAYVRAAPWTCVGVAAALGALLAPARSRPPARRAVADDATNPSAAASTPAKGTALSVLAATIGRTAIAFAAQAAIEYASSEFASSRADGRDAEESLQTQERSGE